MTLKTLVSFLCCSVDNTETTLIIFQILLKMIIFQILAKIDDFSKILPIMIVFQLAAKIDVVFILAKMMIF